MLKFSFFTGDADFLRYGGRWLSNEQKSAGERFFFGICLENWEDLSGEPGPNGETYNLSLVIIPHPLEVSQDRLRNALGFYELPEEPSVEMMADALWNWGIFCPIEEINTSNWRAGMRQLRKVAKELDYRKAMDLQPVNKIGQTGRERIEGDTISCLKRGLAEGKKEAWLLARIYGTAEEELEAEGFQNPFKK